MKNKKVARKIISVLGVALLLAAVIIPALPIGTVFAAADRYFVMGQVYVADDTTTTDYAATRIATGGDTTITVTGGAGDYTIHMANGTTGTVTSGTAAVTGSPLALAAGANTITVDGNGTTVLNLTIGSGANWNSVNSWSLASGGACGAGVPTNATSVAFDANSFTAAGQTVTVDANVSTLDMDWTGATNSPTFTRTGGFYCVVTGNATFIASMTNSCRIYFQGNITSNGLIFSGAITIGLAPATTIMQDEFKSTSSLEIYNGVLNTNNQNIICNNFYFTSNNAKTLTMGSSVFSLSSSWDVSTSTNNTISANTATINIAGTGNCRLGSENWNGASFNLNGTSHAVSGNPTGIDEFNFNPAGAQTITVTDTHEITADSFSRTGTGRITLQGSGVAGWAITDADGGTNTFNTVTVINSTASGGDFIATGASIDGGGNVGWDFPLTVTTQEAVKTPPYIVFTGTLSDMGGEATVNCYFEWGVTPSYGNTTPVQAITALGDFTSMISFPKSYTTVYYRAVSEAGGVTSYGTALSVEVPAATGGLLIRTLLRIAVASVLLIGVARLSGGGGIALLGFSVLGIAAFFIIDAIITTLF